MQTRIALLGAGAVLLAAASARAQTADPTPGPGVPAPPPLTAGTPPSSTPAVAAPAPAAAPVSVEAAAAADSTAAPTAAPGAAPVSPKGAGSLDAASPDATAEETFVEDADDSPRERQTRRTRDAHADRVILFPTAETQPKGSFFVSSYELVLIQVGYAVTDDFQLSALVLPPLLEEQPYFISPTLKLNLVRSEQGNVALLGGVDFITDEDGDESAVLARLGAAGQLCIDPACDSSLTANVHGWTALTEGDGSIIFLSAGATIFVSELVSLLIEPTYPLIVQDGETQDIDFFVLAYGVRLSGSQFGLDLTLARPFGIDDSPFVLGLPFVVASYRSD